MRCLAHPRTIGGVALVAGLLWLSFATGQGKGDEGFTKIFNGKDFTGWKTILKDKDADPAKTWTFKEGVILCSGSPNGYFYTEKSYKNYILRYDWKYVKPEEGKKSTYNSGLLVHITGDHKVWPKCVEVQGANGDHARAFGIGGAKFQGKTDKKDKDEKTKAVDEMKAAQKKAIKPIGEWNTTEIICQDGKITTKINGIEIDAGDGELKEGQIGLQSEGAEIHFRNILIKEMK